MKAKWHIIFLCSTFLFAHHLLDARTAGCAITPGQKAPAFALQDPGGRTYSLQETRGRQMTVLFFFDAQSASNQGGLLMLDQLLRQYQDAQLTVWGITRSKPEQVTRFLAKNDLMFPILFDTGDVSKQYNAKLILPVACAIGPGLQVLDYFQGGGETAETLLVRLAEQQIHRDQPQLAGAMAAAVTRTAPDNAEAKAVQGYAALSEGKTDQAQKIFDQLADAPGKASVIGKEGQAVVLARQGKADQALALANEVAQAAPKRAVAHKVKGDLLMAKGERRAAEDAYQAAVRLPEAAPFQKAEACNQLGRLYADSGRYDQARKLFDQATTLDPFYIEPTSNKGVTYEKQGMWSKALAEYRQVLTLDQSDTIAGVLARKAEQMMAIQKDTARKERIDRLVGTLVQRYKDQKAASPAPSEDDWTSRPMVLSFVDIQESGGLASRDGLAIVLATRLGELLEGSGRVQVVERAVMEQLLTELNLGSSELTDPQVALQLGRLLAAKLIGTGTLLYLPDSTLLNLRLIDTETTAIAKTLTLRLPPNADMERELFNLNREILKAVMQKYPLQGYIVQVNGDQVMLNLGSRQGMTTGSAFDVTEAGEAITYKGRVLQGASKTVGRVEVVRVEPDLSFARIVRKERALARDDQVREVVSSTAVQGNNDGR